MKVARWSLVFVTMGAIGSLSGCYVSKSLLTTSETQNRVLTEQNRAQLVEIENLKAHSKQTEDQLIRSEQELTSAQDQADRNRQRLATYEQEADQLKGLASGKRLPAAVSQQLVALSDRYPNMRFDPETGISKLDIDVLFDSGQTELKPNAKAMLTELAQILQLSEAKDLKIMVVGHTDNQRITGRETRERYANNFHLSTGRALCVADLLRSQGLSDQRIGVAGFGSHEPVVSNESPTDRQKNRRVEIFVMAPDVPVVGWTDSIPGAYY